MFDDIQPNNLDVRNVTYETLVTCFASSLYAEALCTAFGIRNFF